MSEVQKPISVILNEKKDELVELINKDLRELHPSLLEPIVKDVYLAVVEQKKRVEQSESEKYKKELSESLLEKCEGVPVEVAEDIIDN